MLSCNSTKASICGAALSWKYIPQGLGASQYSCRLLINNCNIYINLNMYFFLHKVVLLINPPPYKGLII